MKYLSTAIAAIVLSVSALGSAIASSGAAYVDTSITYNSGILVLAFAGFLALVVVVQTIPAIISLYGMIKGAADMNRQQKTAEVSVRSR